MKKFKNEVMEIMSLSQSDKLKLYKKQKFKKRFKKDQFNLLAILVIFSIIISSNLIN